MSWMADYNPRSALFSVDLSWFSRFLMSEETYDLGQRCYLRRGTALGFPPHHCGVQTKQGRASRNLLRLRTLVLSNPTLSARQSGVIF